ncbi:MAG TPA: methyltransferase domain-containing protein, partial [Gaiellaceae bacterium]|nr:methyltransferase domain-containing protein [Gaiellaceae bacterium]
LFAWHRARYAFALSYVDGKRVLDVGSGEGYGAALLAEHARDVVAVDYSPAAVEHARATYPRSNLAFRVFEATALPDDLASFDVVTCFEVIEHIVDAKELVRNLRGALRPGGILLLSTPNRLVDVAFERVSGRDAYEYHVNVLSPRELRGLVRPEFADVVLYGQSVRGGTLHSVLKAVDVLNLRHHLVRSSRVQRNVGEALGKPEPGKPPEFRFSRLLVRQSPHVVVVARS